jgi:hypothetical protein
MSRYGYIACETCRIYMFVGKYVQPDDGGAPYFHIGDPDEPPNSVRTLETKALWKLHTEHIGHPVRTLVEGTNDLSHIWEFVEIGGDEPQDISFEDYVKDWAG